MKKKKLVLFVFLIVGVLSLILTYKFKQSNLNKNKPIKEEKLSIMIKEDGATDYTKSSSKDIPKGNYVLNEEKTHCENNGQITSYDNIAGTVSFSFIGSDKCYLYFDFKQETITIGTNEIVVNSGKPDFTKVATTNEGMYATEDDYTATTGMKSYYFRGAVDNKWVKFGKDSIGKDIYWRIIRINGDGSIRMIYSGTTAPTESTKVVMTGTGTQIKAITYDFNSSYDKAEYVGYQYIDGEQHGYGECNVTSESCTVNGNTVYNSTIKQAIDEWYAGTTLEKDAATKALVSQDQIFCNDRSTSITDVAYSTTDYTTLTSWNSTGTQYYYGAYGRLEKSKSPQLTCPTASDKFTVDTSNGNGALTYPVGLITADEVAMAGGVYDTNNSSYYLYTNQQYWSGSPYIFHGSAYYAIEFQVNSSGAVDAYAVANDFGARPVISLSSEAKLTGDGTWNNVYEVEKMGYETILANNGGKDTIEAKGNPDFATVATTNEGMYATEDDYTATTGMKSYYFRGAVDNNWVKFGKDKDNNYMYWRIIRVNGDGSIRMIYTGTTAPTESTKVVMTGTGTQIYASYHQFNSSRDKPEYVGYMYTDGEQHGNSIPSDIKPTIENWYARTTLKDNPLVSQDQIFCNDRSVTSGTWSSIPSSDLDYAPYTRLTASTPIPQLKCPTESDKFTSKDSSIGNSALTYPVGLITADEVAMAGGKADSENSTYYLYTNQDYWSGSPQHFYSDDDYAFALNVYNNGTIGNDYVENRKGTRPVISLSSKAKLSGNGTYNDVYIVSSN